MPFVAQGSNNLLNDLYCGVQTGALQGVTANQQCPYIPVGIIGLEEQVERKWSPSLSPMKTENKLTDITVYK